MPLKQLGQSALNNNNNNNNDAKASKSNNEPYSNDELVTESNKLSIFVKSNGHQNDSSSAKSASTREDKNVNTSECNGALSATPGDSKSNNVSIFI
jgi:hypothetical protein